MSHSPASNLNPDIDPVWRSLCEEAELVRAAEPAMAGFIYATILNHTRLEDSVIHRLSMRLEHSDVDAGLLRQTFEEVLVDHPDLGEAFRSDFVAVRDRDPACERFLEPLLYFKGFHALQTHRIAHELWKDGRRDFAFYLQSQASRIFTVDIHPAAQIGRGIMIDHATGIVVGETATIGDNVSILHNVTLGGTGKVGGDRHPKIGNNVMIGAGAKILGNIQVGCCSRIASGSVVLKDVPPESTVAGVPAKVIGKAGCSEPAMVMDQMLSTDLLEGKNPVK